MDFEVHGPQGKFIKRFKTRDILLQRAMRYAAAVRTRRFWIDQGCFDQDNADERQAAMDSMDLVYQRSAFPVALLEITFESREVDLMTHLLSHEAVDLDAGVGHDRTAGMVGMLKHLQQDKWWTRAWTLHEEYLAGEKLRLLIRYTMKEGDYKKSKFTGIKGELRVPAMEFRHRAIRFLQYLQYDKTAKLELQDTCEALLHTFRHFSLGARPTESNRERTMSLSILENFGRRDLSESYDSLLITANVCGYEVRLRSDQLAKNLSHSVGLCILAMRLLNGEMFHNEDTVPNPEAGVGLSEYLDTVSLDNSSQASGLFALPASTEHMILRGISLHRSSWLKA
jgi:hypothetical protein